MLVYTTEETGDIIGWDGSWDAANPASGDLIPVKTLTSRLAERSRASGGRYVTSFYSISHCSNSEYLSQIQTQSGNIHSTILDVHVDWQSAQTY